MPIANIPIDRSNRDKELQEHPLKKINASQLSPLMRIGLEGDPQPRLPLAPYPQSQGQIQGPTQSQSSSQVSSPQPMLRDPLPKILSEDRRIERPESFFTFATSTGADGPREGRYKYVRLLGHGAYGLVCAAMDNSTGASVAIKRINQINSLLVARRTLRELKLLRHFRGHPNIITVRDLFLLKPSTGSGPGSGSNGDFEELFITQDLMNADLCHIIQSRYPLSDEHCQRFLYQMLRGLKALHSANVIHRDLKPGNLLWKQSGELRLCDFGLARGIAEESSTQTQGEMALTNYVATRWYRPPEILLYRSSYGKPLDMWSVGCIFAEMLGRRVFLPGQSGFEQLHLILQKLGTPSESVIEAIPSTRSKTYLRRLPRYPSFPLNKRFPMAPPSAIDLLEKLLAFDPASRITVEDALAHPYLARWHDPAKEPSYPSFDFSFDRALTTLPQIKDAILAEVALYRPISPSLNMPINEEEIKREESPQLSKQVQHFHIASNGSSHEK